MLKGKDPYDFYTFWKDYTQNGTSRQNQHFGVIIQSLKWMTRFYNIFTKDWKVTRKSEINCKRFAFRLLTWILQDTWHFRKVGYFYFILTVSLNFYWFFQVWLKQVFKFELIAVERIEIGLVCEFCEKLIMVEVIMVPKW